jgi:hypothetical protein
VSGFDSERFDIEPFVRGRWHYSLFCNGSDTDGRQRIQQIIDRTTTTGVGLSTHSPQRSDHLFFRYIFT